MKLFWSLLLCAAVIFAPSTFSAAQASRINTANLECREYKDSVSEETMFALSVEAYQNLWGAAVKWMANVKDNEVKGWKYKYTVNKDWGFSCTVWENAYNENTYAMVLSGTDDFIGDILGTYLPMMLSEEPCAQLKSTVEETINMKNHGLNRIDRLFIAGYSLGGFLSNYLATELVDSAKGLGNKSGITLGQISPTLTLEEVKCFSYAAPGFYSEKINLPEIDKVISKVEGLVNKVTTWAAAKISRDKDGVYDDNIINIMNGRDPVANLFISPKNFKQVGVVKNVVNPGNPPLANVTLIGNLIGALANNTGPIGELLFHAPDLYFNCINMIKQGKFKVA